MLKIVIFPIIVVLGLVVASVVNKNVTQPINVTNIISKEGISLDTTPKATPFLFEEMTIPFLRERKYESSLGQIQKISENGSYTAYITSFDSDGLKVNGLLTIPKGEKPSAGWPAIVFIHGYIPPAQYNTTQNYVSYISPFASNGFVVFKIDLRGHGSSEGDASGAYYSGDYIIDTLNAHQALASSDFVNPNAIGLWGHSMAGNVVLRSVAAKPQIPAAVIWAGAGFSYTDLQEYRISDSSYRSPPPNSERSRKRQLLRDTYGDFSPTHPFWRQVAATNYVNDLKGAISLHHAVDDNVVNIGYSRNLNNILNNTAVVHELFEYQSGGHNLTGSSFNLAMSRSVAFFKKYLTNSPQ